MKYFWLYILACLSLVSCEVNLQIPFPEHTPQLTLNSFIVEGQQVFLYVSRSFSALENFTEEGDTILLVKDADVTVWRNGERLGDMEFVPSGIDTLREKVQDTVFEFTLFVNKDLYEPIDSLPLPAAGDVYEFQVSHPDYGTASASTTVLPQPEVLDAQLVIDSLTSTDFDGYQDNWTALKITVQDPGIVANAYLFEVNVRGTTTYDDGAGGTFVDTIIYSVFASTSIQLSGEGYYYGENFPIRDTEFNGQQQELLTWIRLPNCCGYPGDIQFREDIELLEIEIRTVLLDQAYAQYKEKYDIQITSRTEGIEGAIFPREPVSVVGNVEGGYGMVSSFNGSSFTKKL